MTAWLERSLFWVVLYGLFSGLPLKASPSTDLVHYQLSTTISETALRIGEEIEASVRLDLAENSGELCFYLAYNDPLFFYDPSQDLSRTKSMRSVVRPQEGMIRIDESSSPYRVESPHLVRFIIPKSQRLLEFTYSFGIPRWPDRTGNQFLFQQFYPQLLDSCPDEAAQSYNYPITRQITYEMDIQWPRRWDLTSPAVFIGRGRLQANYDLSFNLSKSYQIDVFNEGPLDIQMIYLSDQFGELKQYVHSFIVSLEKALGPFPYPKLLILETEDLERTRVPGVITLNRPKQKGMQSIQGEYLNWIQWQLAFAVAEQWIGTSVTPSNFDDFWFFRGTAEFAASLALQQDPRVKNIFASRDDSEPWFYLSYSQAVDLAASTQRGVHTHLLIELDTLESREEFFHQDNYTHIRQVLALRYLYWFYGDDFLIKMQDFLAKYHGRRVSHVDFKDFLKSHPRLERDGQMADDLLLRWWTTNDWPEFGLENIRSEASGAGRESKLHVTISRNTDLILPIDVLVKTRSGKELRQVSTEDSPLSTLSFELPAGEGYRLVEINPGREVYDENRFNNSNRGPRLSVFPGSANTLKDDAYTLVWFPYPSLLPGESLTLNLGLQVFRYVSAGMSGLISYQPADGRVGFSLNYEVTIPNWNSQATIHYIQNQGTSYRGERLAGLSLSRTTLFLRDTRIESGLQFNIRETMSDIDSRHAVGGVNLGFGSRRNEYCNYALTGARQRTLGGQSLFSYTRDTATVQLNCRANGIGVDLRAFWGNLESSGNVSRNVSFSPQELGEARLRIDRPSLEPVDAIKTVGLDISWPARLPLPSSFFVLPRQTEWRLSGDYGESSDPFGVYSNAGLGFRIPFGGDVVGRKSIAFLNFTVMTILYRRYPDDSSYKPGIIFDFMGKL